MPWDSVEVGLAGGEETVNFGPRNESGSSLYQVDTLASVSPRGEVKTKIHTSCSFTISWSPCRIHRSGCSYSIFDFFARCKAVLACVGLPALKVSVLWLQTKWFCLTQVAVMFMRRWTLVRCDTLCAAIEVHLIIPPSPWWTWCNFNFSGVVRGGEHCINYPPLPPPQDFSLGVTGAGESVIQWTYCPQGFIPHSWYHVMSRDWVQSICFKQVGSWQNLFWCNTTGVDPNHMI